MNHTTSKRYHWPTTRLLALDENYAAAPKSYSQEPISEDSLVLSLTKSLQQVRQLLTELEEIDRIVNSDELHQQTPAPDSQDLTPQNLREISAADEYWRQKKADERHRHSVAIEFWRKKLDQQRFDDIH